MAGGEVVTAADRSEMRVLLVEDDADIAVSVTDGLQRHGLDVDVVNRGRPAIEAQPGTVHRREQLLERVWDMNWFGSTKTLDVHVASLRKKLGDPGWIETVRGVGFRAARVG